MKVALYARVSTNRDGRPDGQTTESQLLELRRYCEFQRWDISGEYVDQGYARKRTSRPELDRLMDDAKLKKFDTILVWKVDRFGCKMTHAVMILEKLHEKYGINFVSLKDGFDTSTASGRGMLAMLVVFANMEREFMSERAKARHSYNRSQGKFPKTYHITITNEELSARLAAGESLRSVARSLGCTVSLLSHRLRHPLNRTVAA